MKTGINKKTIVSSLAWKFMERGGVQGIMFVVSIILARLLMPEDYGIVALTAIFLRIARVIIYTGFNSSLIYKKDADETDFSSVFYLSLLVALVIYILLYFLAPYIASFYDQQQIVSILRVLSITLFICAISTVQNAIISRNMMFKKLFYSSLFSVVISGAIGISMAYYGYGIWALAVQEISAQLITTIVLFITTNWRPRLLFSFKRIKHLLSYGSKISISTLLDTVDTEIRSFIIGKIYNASILGFYNRGKKLPQEIITSVDGTMQSVIFPALSAQQDDIQMIKKMIQRSIITSTFVIFPIMIGMAAIARPLTIILLTEKWLPCVPYLQMFCFAYALWPINTANLQAIKALGKSDIYLKLEIIKKGIGLVTLLIAIPLGIFYIALSVPINSLIATVVNIYPNAKLLNYSLKEQVKDILPSIILSIFMGIIVFCIKFIGLSNFVTLIIQMLVGIVIYIGLAKLLNISSLSYLIKSIRELFNK